MRTKEQLNKDIIRFSKWVDDLREKAERDEDFSCSVFEQTEEPFVIVGGWSDGFSKDYNDVLYISKSNPTYAMCIKIAINDGPQTFTDYDLMDMPVDSIYEVEDTNIALERGDVSSAIAEFYLRELDRMIDDHK